MASEYGYLEILGARIRRARCDKNITQEDLATLISVDKSFVSRIENGKRENLSVAKIKEIASVLDVPVNELLED